MATSSSSLATEQLLGSIDDLINQVPSSDMPITDRPQSYSYVEQPPIHTTIFFSGHEHPDDMQGVEPLLSKADIYFAEGTGSITGVARKLADLQLIANTPPATLHERAEDDLVDKISASYGSELGPVVRGLLGSRAIVASIDLGREHQDLVKQIVDAYDNVEDYYNGDFDQALESEMKRAATIGDLQLARERIMHDQRKEKIAEILESHPELRWQRQIEIVETLGALHTSYYRRMKRAGENVDRSFPTDGSYSYGFQDQLVREVMFGRPQPSKELIAKAYLEGSLYDMLLKSADTNLLNSSEVNLYLRSVVSPFTLAEIERFYYQDKAGALALDDVDAILGAKGLPRLPQSEDELSVAAGLFMKGD